MRLGFADILLILLIASLVFGWRNLPDLPRSMRKAMKELKRQAPVQLLDTHDLRVLITTHLGVALFIVITSLALADVISADQTMVVTAVVFVWLIVGFYCFGKKD